MRQKLRQCCCHIPAAAELSPPGVWGTLGGMPPADQPRRSSRETRLLLVTIAVAVGVLLLLARFRFPEQAGPPPAEPAPAPLERLAARAAYDELASTMADLERRILPRVMLLPVRSERVTSGFVVAPRVMADRAVALLGADETWIPSVDTPVEVMARDLARELAVLSLPPAEDAVVSPRAGAPRTGPRYVVVVEGTSQGPILRPVYVGRTTIVQEPRTGTPHLQLSALQHSVAAGSAVFSLDGLFIGLVREGGTSTMVVPGDFLRTVAERAQPTAARGVGSIGVEVQPLTSALARATGADHGVMVSHAKLTGPSTGVLQAGDVIQSVDGTAVTTVAGFRQIEQTRTPGEPVTLTIVRAGDTEQVTVRAVDVAAPIEQTTEDHGIVGRSIPNVGIEVVAVQAGSPAARAGLERGDLILRVGPQQSPDLNAVARAFRAAKPGDVLLVNVQRSRQHHVLALEKR